MCERVTVGVASLNESAATVDPISVRPRRIWIAVLLALLSGPLAAFAYCGKFSRGLVWIIAFWLSMFTGMALMLYVPNGPTAIISGALVLVAQSSQSLSMPVE